MIKMEHVVLPSPEQMEFIIEGMRNPLNSWDKSDSDAGECFFLGDNDKGLMERLAEAGTDHRKFMRMMPVMLRVTAPLYWWKEADTYKVGTVANSCSTMHKIHAKEFTLEDFSCEHLFTEESNQLLNATIAELNENRHSYLKTNLKEYWQQMIQLLPSSYNQTRNWLLNYEVLANIYHSRRTHKLNEWRVLCKWIETLPYSYIIVGSQSEV